MTSPKWIKSAVAVRLLRDAGLMNPAVLGTWAHDGLLRARAHVERIAGAIEKETLTHDAIPRWFWGHLNDCTILADWAAGIFETEADYDGEYGWQQTTWRISGVEFEKNDLHAQLGGNTVVQSGAPTFRRSVLPPSASHSDRAKEQAAHHAASIVQAEGVKRSEAFRRVLNIAKKETQSSQERALRRAYGLMYDSKGEPHPN